MLKLETYFKFPIASLSLKGCLQGIGAQFFNSADITDEVRGVKGEYNFVITYLFLFDCMSP